MKIKLNGVVYDTTMLIDSQINHVIELNRITGMEGQDVLDGFASAAAALSAGRVPGMDGYMASAAIVWLARRHAGEQVGFEEACAGLSLEDVFKGIEDDAPQGGGVPSSGQAPDPTPPGSAPVTAVAAPELPTPMLEPVTPAPSPSPGLGSLPPSSSIDSLSSTSGQA